MAHCQRRVSDSATEHDREAAARHGGDRESLRAVEADFESINEDLTVPRDPMCREVVDNLITGYEYVDALVQYRPTCTRQLAALAATQWPRALGIEVSTSMPARPNCTRPSGISTTTQVLAESGR